jgi:hypothetical protein
MCNFKISDKSNIECEVPTAVDKLTKVTSLVQDATFILQEVD